MKKELFDELLASVREGGAILRGEQAPSKSSRVEGPDGQQRASKEHKPSSEPQRDNGM